MTLSGTSQDSTTCLPNRQLRIAIEKIERGEQAQREVTLLRQNEGHWQSIVRERDSIISIMKGRERGYAAIEDGYVQRLKIAEENYNSTRGDLMSKLKKQRRRTLLWALGGIVTTSASIYFLR
jgi:hypothetical protein